MAEQGQQTSGSVKVTLPQAMKMIGPYARERLFEQIKSVWLIVTYLILFQILVLGVAISDASVIAVGIALVVAGLTFFMEGLVLGLMPLGNFVGTKLPQKQGTVVMLLFALGLGILATKAEPAIGVLKAAGGSVEAWRAPLLFLLLNRESSLLVDCVGLGVGVAVMFGMLRFKYGWSLKPFIYFLVGGLVVATGILCFKSGNFLHLAGLAWDCGAVTTGPVTVPLVLALGIGISRMLGDSGGGASGFGVVTLASLFPIITVLLLGAYFSGMLPNPINSKSENLETEISIFFAKNEKTDALFENEDAKLSYMIQKTNVTVHEKYLSHFPKAHQEKISEKLQSLREKLGDSEGKIVPMGELLLINMELGVRAIGLLGIPMLLVLWVLLREKLPRSDETFLGLFFAVIGMGIFSLGIELGLTKLGNQIGSKLPASYKNVLLSDEISDIKNFTPNIVQTAIKPNGEKEKFFTAFEDGQYKTIPFNENNFDATNDRYKYTPSIGPLYGIEGSIGGILVVLIFAFILGYGATLAEPALNALGATVEELTVGTFKKSLLMQAVAIGVAFGIALGVAKIMFDLPLIAMCGPPYVLLLFITRISTEEFVNIGWDSAGVTTGPITVPLVLAMGLGIGGEVGVVEGFCILSMASVCPILSVLCVGLFVTAKRKKTMENSEIKTDQLAVTTA